MKKLPSASVRPPSQTTQRVPIRSSKPGEADGGYGGVASAAAATSSGAEGGASSTEVVGSTWEDVTHLGVLVGSGATKGESGGAGCAPKLVASMASSRVRNLATWSNALRA